MSRKMLAALAFLLLSVAGCGQITAPANNDSKVGAVAPAQTKSPFYEGKTITFLVPFSAGGGTDTRARLVAKYLAEFIPGKPQILVENKPGGGGALAFNFLATRVKPDGLTVGVASPGIPLRWLTEQEGHDYALDKMTIMAASAAPTVHYLSGKLKGIEEIDQRKQPVKSAHTDVSSSIAVIEKLAGQLLGIEFDQIGGYNGYSETKLAVLRGEVEASGSESDSYLTDIINYVKSNDVIPLFQSGIISEGAVVKDPRIEVPTITEVYQKLRGKSPETDSNWPAIKAMAALQTLGASFWLPEGVPADRAKELIAAYKDMLNSPVYQQEVQKLMGGTDFMLIGDEAKSAFVEFTQMPTEVRKLVK